MQVTLSVQNAIDGGRTSAISEVLDGRYQLPLGPHANLILVHRLVDDLKCHKRGQFKTLQTDADLGGALSDHADVRRGGDDFVDTARALFGTVFGELKRQSSDRRQWVSGKLKRGGQVTNKIKRAQASHKEAHELRQLAQLGRQPLELVVENLKHKLEVRSRSTQFEFSYCEMLEQRQLADFSWQRRELVVADLKAR